MEDYSQLEVEQDISAERPPRCEDIGGVAGSGNCMVDSSY